MHASLNDIPLQALWFHAHARGTNRHAGRIHYRMEYLARQSGERVIKRRRIESSAPSENVPLVVEPCSADIQTLVSRTKQTDREWLSCGLRHSATARLFVMKTGWANTSKIFQYFQHTTENWWVKFQSAKQSRIRKQTVLLFILLNFAFDIFGLLRYTFDVAQSIVLAKSKVP